MIGKMQISRESYLRQGAFLIKRKKTQWTNLKESHLLSVISLTSAPFVMKNHVVVQAVSNMMRFAIFWCDPVGLKVVGVWGWWDILLMADNFTPRCVRSWQGLDDSDVHGEIERRSIKLVRYPKLVPVAAWTWSVPYITTSSGKSGITVQL